MPVGAVITFAGAVCPTGYLLANGSAISRTDYEDLFNVIGTSHGEGDGTTTFHLPDYRGRFLRGVYGAAGNDPDAASRIAMNTGGNTGDNVGSVQDDQLRSHNHVIPARTGPGASMHDQTSRLSAGTATASADFNFTAMQDTGGNETRPKNAYVNFCVKH